MINLHIDELEKRWGNFKKIDNKKVNCLFATKNGKDYYFNTIVDPISLDKQISYYKKFYNYELPEFLKEIYSFSNGFELFSASLNILGIKDDSQILKTPFDSGDYGNASYLFFNTFKENYKKKTKKEYPIKFYKDFEYKFFGAMGENYLSFKPGDEKIYVLLGEDEKELIKTFNNFQECYDHYFYGLMDRYDEKGMNKYPNEIFKAFPFYYNKTFKDF